VEWLKCHNDKFEDPWDKVRFYGLDMYCLFTSADLVIEYLEKVDKKDAELAKQRYGSLDQYRNDEFEYGRDVALKLTPSREREVVAMLVTMMNRGWEYLQGYGGFIRHYQETGI